MKKETKNGKIVGYFIGNNIKIHWHINDADSWFITIRELNIFG